jgi:hypothetical protein
MTGHVVWKSAQAELRVYFVRVERHENGNANELVVIKCSVPYTAGFGFGLIKLA